MIRITLLFVLMTPIFVQAQEPLEGPFLDRAIERIEARQTKAIEEVNAKIRIVDRLFNRVEVADKDRGVIRQSISGLITGVKDLQGEQTRLGGAFSEIRNNLKVAKEERITAREERKSFLEKLAEYQNNRPTLAGRLFWLVASACVSVLMLGGVVLLLFRFFPGVRRLLLGV